MLDKFDGVKWVAEPNAVDTGSPPKIVVPQDSSRPTPRRALTLQQSSR